MLFRNLSIDQINSLSDFDFVLRTQVEMEFMDTTPYVDQWRTNQLVTDNQRILLLAQDIDMADAFLRRVRQMEQEKTVIEFNTSHLPHGDSPVWRVSFQARMLLSVHVTATADETFSAAYLRGCRTVVAQRRTAVCKMMAYQFREMGDQNTKSLLLRNIVQTGARLNFFLVVGLLINGADPQQQDATGKDAIALCEHSNQSGFASALRRFCLQREPATFEILLARLKSTLAMQECDERLIELTALCVAIETSELTATQKRQLLFNSEFVTPSVNLARVITSNKILFHATRSLFASIQHLVDQGFSPDVIAVDLGLRNDAFESVGGYVSEIWDSSDALMNDDLKMFLRLLRCLVEKGANPETIAELLRQPSRNKLRFTPLVRAEQRNSTAEVSDRVVSIQVCVAALHHDECIALYLSLLNALRAVQFPIAQLLNQSAADKLTVSEMITARCTDPVILLMYIELADDSTAPECIKNLQRHKDAIFTHILTLSSEIRTPMLHAIRDRTSVLGKVFASNDMRLLNARIDHALGITREKSTSHSFWDQQASIRSDSWEKIRSNWKFFSKELQVFLIRLQKDESNTERLKALNIEPESEWLDSLTADLLDIPVRLPGTTAVFDLGTVLGLQEKEGSRTNPLNNAVFTLNQLTAASDVQDSIEREIAAAEAKQPLKQATSSATNSSSFWSTAKPEQSTPTNQASVESRLMQISVELHAATDPARLALQKRISDEIKSITTHDELSVLLRKVAVLNPHRDVIDALLDAGANPWQLAQTSQMTAIDRAMSEGHFGLAKYMSEHSIAKAATPVN